MTTTELSAATPEEASAHFDSRLRFETDPADVAKALARGDSGFVIIDARSRAAYDAAHLPGAYNLSRPFQDSEVARLPDGLIVVYCWGPGCNGATKAAAQLAKAGRPVKEMIGGFEYWVREGHPVEGTESATVMRGVDADGLVKLRGEISCLC